MPTAPLIDRFRRNIEYLRLSVTDRCDLRCAYCMPEDFKDYEEPGHWLDFDEIERVVAAFADLGVKRLRLTGGEPLLRRDLAGLVTRLAALPGIEDMSLSTNATQLARYADALRRGGISRINVSLDSLRRERIERITGRDCLDSILAGLMAGKDAGFAPIKINMVAMQGVNEDEIDDMVGFCIKHGFILRFIETMPMGDTGRGTQFLDLQPVRLRLRERFGLEECAISGAGPARYFKSGDGKFSLGFITPMSQHFCDTCNRVRLGVDGTLYTCLGQDENLPLRPLLRGGATDEGLKQAIRAAIDLKPERHEFREKPGKIARIMSSTGG